MFNHIAILGRLTRDPEYRTTGSGLSVANFSVAVDRDFPGQSGEKETDFIDCVAWRKTAEFVTKYMKKGSMVVVSGRLQIRAWTDKDGNKRRTAEVVAENVYFAESKRTAEGGAAAPAAPTPAPSYQAPVTPSASDFALLDDDDAQLPF